MQRLRTEAHLEAAFAADRYLLFKHSTRCPISAEAFEEYRSWAAAHPEVPTGWVDVIEDRELARTTAERAGVRHESPQAMLLSEGRVIWHASHGKITLQSLERAADSPGLAEDQRQESS